MDIATTVENVDKIFFLLSMPGINEILIPWPIGFLGEKSQ